MDASVAGGVVGFISGRSSKAEAPLVIVGDETGVTGAIGGVIEALECVAATLGGVMARVSAKSMTRFCEDFDPALVGDLGTRE